MNKLLCEVNRSSGRFFLSTIKSSRLLLVAQLDTFNGEGVARFYIFPQKGLAMSPWLRGHAFNISIMRVYYCAEEFLQLIKLMHADHSR